jgi:hypothetical protein
MKEADSIMSRSTTKHGNGLGEESHHVEIRSWAIVTVATDERTTTHVIGYVVTHRRLGDVADKPYISRPLVAADLARRIALNQRGKSIALVGDPLRSGELPKDIDAVLRRAEREWALRGDVTWWRLLIRWPAKHARRAPEAPASRRQRPR